MNKVIANKKFANVDATLELTPQGVYAFGRFHDSCQNECTRVRIHLSLTTMLLSKLFFSHNLKDTQAKEVLYFVEKAWEQAKEKNIWFNELESENYFDSNGSSVGLQTTDCIYEEQ